MSNLEVIRKRNEIQLEIMNNHKKLTDTEKEELNILLDLVEAERAREEARLQSQLDT